MKIKTISIGDLIRVKERKRRTDDHWLMGKVGLVVDKLPNAFYGQVEYRVKVPGNSVTSFVRSQVERAVAK